MKKYFDLKVVISGAIGAAVAAAFVTPLVMSLKAKVTKTPAGA